MIGAMIIKIIAMIATPPRSASLYFWTGVIVLSTRAVLQAMIEELRRRGSSWEAIGKALGVSRQAAWERFS